MTTSDDKLKAFLQGDVSLDGIKELAARAPDMHWRELRIYFRKLPDGTAQIRVGQELRIVQIDQKD